MKKATLALNVFLLATRFFDSGCVEDSVLSNNDRIARHEDLRARMLEVETSPTLDGEFLRGIKIDTEPSMGIYEPSVVDSIGRGLGEWTGAYLIDGSVAFINAKNTKDGRQHSGFQSRFHPDAEIHKRGKGLWYDTMNQANFVRAKKIFQRALR